MHVEGGKATATTVAGCDREALEARRSSTALVTALIAAAAAISLQSTPAVAGRSQSRRQNAAATQQQQAATQQQQSASAQKQGA